MRQNTQEGGSPGLEAPAFFSHKAKELASMIAVLSMSALIGVMVAGGWI